MSLEEDSKGRNWRPHRDPTGRFSTGVPSFDELLGGGFRHGGVVLVNADVTIGPEDLHGLLTPTWLNFLLQSRGLLAVLPARQSPEGFRKLLLEHTTRRLFDSRVRVIEYVGEGGPHAPYIVHAKHSLDPPSKKGREEAMVLMSRAERAVRGARGRPYVEYSALETLETLVGSEMYSRMVRV
jgi:GvpD gas vesicle protein